MINAVINKIRLLKSIQPNPDWLQSEKGKLLFAISQSGKKSRFSWNLLPDFVFPKFKLILKPAIVLSLVLGLISSSGILIAFAAQHSLPGDLLYPIKIVLEDLRVTVSSQEIRPKLQIEFVGNRLEELNQIITEEKNPLVKKEKVVETVDKLQAQVISTKVNLNNLRNKKLEPQKIAETSGAITEQVVQSEKVLIEVKEKLVRELPKEESQKVVEAIDEMVKEIQETSTLASEIKQEKSGIEVQMEVKNIEPEVEKFNDK